MPRGHGVPPWRNARALFIFTLRVQRATSKQLCHHSGRLSRPQEKNMAHKDEDLVFSLFFIAFALFTIFLTLIGLGVMVWGLM